MPGICDGVGKDLVALGIMRKVDAGASTFLGSGFGMLAVWSSGPGHDSVGLLHIKVKGAYTYVCEKACARNVELEQTICELCKVSYLRSV